MGLTEEGERNRGIEEKGNGRIEEGDREESTLEGRRKRFGRGREERREAFEGVFNNTVKGSHQGL